MTIRIACALLIGGSFLLFGQQDEAGKYRWPLDIDNGYSSSFQEFRSNHFHAGLDLRTFQETGWPVYAIADGRIYKIRMVKRGSGRGLYLKHNDGNTSIYFHLDRFNDRIENILRRVQAARGKKYFGNYFLKYPLAVNKGEIIAYSGETGSGFPHLHLEIRDPAQFALNPFPLLEFPKRDKNFPRLRRLVFRNRGDSLVNGRVGEGSLRFLAKSRSRYVLEEPLVVTGAFDLVLQAVDISDSGKSVAPYRISALLDGEEFLDLTFERFSWDDNNQLGFVYDMFYSRASSYFFNLFYQQGFALENRQVFPEDILGSLGTGRHELRLLVRDNFGNESIGIADLYKIEEPGIEITGLEREGSGLLLNIEKLAPGFCPQVKISLYDGAGQKLYRGELNLAALRDKQSLRLSGISAEVAYMDVDFCRQGQVYLKKRHLLDQGLAAGITDIDIETFINRDEIFIAVKNPLLTAQNVVLNVSQGPDSRLLKPRCSADNIFFRFKPMNPDNRVRLNFVVLRDNEKVAEIQEQLHLVYLEPGVKQTFASDEFTARFDARAVYEPRVLLVRETSYDSEFPLLSKQVSLSPYHFPFLDTVHYTFKKSVPHPEQVGIFRCDPQGRSWRYVSSRYNPAAQLFKTRVISSGIFALMRDMFPPEIYLIKPHTRYFGHLKQLVVKITDKGKGVDDASLKVWLNGQRLDCEYDPDWRSVRIDDLAAARRGRNVLRAEVKDYAGNGSSRTFSFHLN